MAVAYLAQAPQLSPEWRLLVITGFCGGLSTFSTFSAEIVSLLQRGLYSWAAGAIVVHVAGSVLMTLAGIATMAWFKPS
ncbi:fluoride exporter (plasmid) [Caballeronia sp. S22]